jgi:hypothetical protein
MSEEDHRYVSKWGVTCRMELDWKEFQPAPTHPTAGAMKSREVHWFACVLLQDIESSRPNEAKSTQLSSSEPPALRTFRGQNERGHCRRTIPAERDIGAPVNAAIFHRKDFDAR